MKKIIKTLMPIATIGATAGIIVPITGCNKTDGTIAGIVITSKPTKLKYAEGQYLDLSGLEVKLVKKDGTSEITKNYTTSIADKTRLTQTGTKNIVVKCNDASVTDSFDIEVTDAIVTKLEITQDITKYKFAINDPLTLDGLKIKATKSNDTVIDDFREYKTEPEVGSTLTKWGRNKIKITCDDGLAETEVFVTTTATKWSEATWEMVADWAYALEANVINEAEFLAHFLKNDGQPYSALTDFIGLEKKIDINGKQHSVKIIDVKHDIIDSPEYFETETKAIFTFQFFNKITTATGDCLQTIYNQNEEANYVSSQLRYNLNKQGSSKTINWDSTTETRSLLEMLPAEFDNYIWPVKKVVACKAIGESSFTLKQYTDRLFLPTTTEYNQTDLSPAIIMTEGTPYAFWKNHTEEDRKVYVVGKTDTKTYYTASPNTSEKATTIIAIKPESGEFGAFAISGTAEGIAPCFCI